MTVIINSDVVLSSSPVIPPFPFTHTRIGYDSWLPQCNVIASSEEAGFPADAVLNPLPYDWWRPTGLTSTLTFDRGAAVEADYIGLAGHNMGDHGVVVTAEYSPDNVTWTQVAEFSPGRNVPIMILFTKATMRFVRLTFVAESIFRLGVAYCGVALAMQRAIYAGHSPINLARTTTFINSRSDAGQWLGRSVIRKGSTTSFDFNNLTPDWYREYFEPFVQAARFAPFFIAWRPSTYPNEVGYCWTERDIVPQNSGTRGFMNVSLQVQGLTDD
jgi:hypothetical protein